VSFNGSGVFVINSTGQPVVTNTIISSTVQNALTADLATGLSTCITKDGQQTVTANIPFAGFKITGLGVATTSGDAISYGQAATLGATTITSTSANALAVGANGTTNPVLDIDASTASVATGLKVKGAAAAAGLALSVITSGTNEALTIDAAGSGTITLGGTSTGAIIHTRATTLSAALTYGSVTLSNSVTGTGSMVLSANPTLTGTVNAASATLSGTLGIQTGTVSPGTVLTLGSSAQTNASLRARGAGNNIEFGHPNSSGYGSTLGSEAGTGDSFLAFNAEAGTTNSTYKTRGLNGFVISNFGPGNRLTFNYLANANADNQSLTEYGAFANDGSFLVGTTGASGWTGNGKINSQMSVNGWALSGYNSYALGGGALALRVDSATATLANFFYNGASTVGSITTNGTTTAYNTSSDARLKQNIADAGDAGAIIDALKVRQWDWKSNNSHETFGFVAQEEAAVYAEAVVQGDDDPTTITRQWSRDDSKLVPLLVKEVQSLRKRVKTLEGTY
jgi:hypothetical protein